MYWLSGWWPTYVTIVARGGHGGYMAPCEDEADRGGLTKAELLARVRVALGGRGAEALFCPGEGGLSTGPASDLEHATSITRRMVCQYGMDEDFGLLVTPELMKYEAALSSPAYLKINEAAGKILKEQMDETNRLLSEHRDHLEAVAQGLLERERLTAEDLQGILPAIPSPSGDEGAT